MARPNRKQFRSKFEYLVAVDLYDRGVKFEYETIKLPVLMPVYKGKCETCGGSRVHSARVYTPDFYLPEHKVLIEAKGNFSSTNRTRMDEVFKSNPDVEVRMLFMRNNYLTKKKASSYGDWCDKRGIKWAVGRVPEEWINE